MNRLKLWAKAMKTRLILIYITAKDPHVSWPIKAIAVITVAYALSPIDLIPDFIPVLGYVDDVLIVPFGIWLVWKLLKEEDRHRLMKQAKEWQGTRLPRNRLAAVMIVVIWILVLTYLLYIFFYKGR